MRELTIKEINASGIRTHHTIMDNGEKRYRLISDKDKTSYIRTECQRSEELQKSHYHKHFKEMYIVQKGQIDIYQYIDKKIIKKHLVASEYLEIKNSIPHNVYTYPNAVIHTVKYGNSQDEDWYAYPELDEMLKKILKSSN